MLCALGYAYNYSFNAKESGCQTATRLQMRLNVKNVQINARVFLYMYIHLMKLSDKTQSVQDKDFKKIKKEMSKMCKFYRVSCKVLGIYM